MISLSNPRSVVLLILFFFVALPDSSPAQGGLGGGCNLAPNPAFEAVSTSGLSGLILEDWKLNVETGIATSQVVKFPEPARSGAHAARVSVSSPGNAYLTNGDGSAGIRVRPSTEYRVGVGLLSSGGDTASLRVVEWAAAGGQTASRLLGQGGGTGEWVTIEGTFVTEASTRYLAVRLVHDVDDGDFYWDDPLVSVSLPGVRCVDQRHYYAQTVAANRMCSGWLIFEGEPVRWCHDREKRPDRSLIVSTALFDDAGDYLLGNFGVIDHNTATGSRIGTHQNIDIIDGSRCFADVGDSCGSADGTNATFPPLTLNVETRSPVVAVHPMTQSASDIGAISSGAKLIHGWQPFDIRPFDFQSGSQGAVIGTIWHRQWAWVADAIDFGGTVGLRQNVLVIEEEQVGGVNPIGFNGGERMERYWYVQGLGRLGQSHWEDTVCRANTTAVDCDGSYDDNPGGLLAMTHQVPEDIDFGSLVPPGVSFNVVDWWR